MSWLVNGVMIALGIRIATFSDDTSLSRASSGSPRTRGEQAVSRLLAEAARSGMQVHVIGLDKPDILYYLDEAICQRIAPDFPGWDAAQAERTRTGSRVSWKRRIEGLYALPLTRESVRQLARTCRQEEKVPGELTQKVLELSAYATATGMEN